MAKPIAIPTIRARVDPLEELAKAEARLRTANHVPNYHRAAKAMDDACDRVLGITAQTRADRLAQERAADWQDNRERRISDAVTHIETMETYRHRRVLPGRPYARKAE
ncbi:MAG: hypothetical protein ABS75_07360 [Pelagibacterium sp. SCN 63-23]|nr:MAG: hypothetical protein ABS75_07360 [Pelagibacterium sp. SCN 63-23]